ncbi:MAG: hypothetical protein ACFBSE_13990 [Prochloraceae cyanobacterium]
MEFITSAAIAIGSLVATKALEKTGEKVGEVVFDRATNLLSSLKSESPNTVAAIEQSPDTPLNYGDAVLELEAAAQKNPKIKENTKALVDAVQSDNLPNLEPILKEILEALNFRKDISETYNIEKVVNFAKGDIKIENQTNIEADTYIDGNQINTKTYVAGNQTNITNN